MQDTVLNSRAVLTRHARSFRLAGRFLPGAQLDEAAVVYAFCRTVDDAVDEAPDEAAGAAALDHIAAQLDDPAPASPTVAAFREICARRGIPLHAARDLIAGVGSDVGPVLLADDAALTRYSYQVAGTVGVMMCGVLGVRDQTAWSHAIALGVGMQITNICRDVVEDAARGRIYLPLTRLAAAGIPASALLSGRHDRAALAGVVSDLLDLADENYAYAEGGMAAIPWRGRLGILIASRLYRAIGVRLRRVHGCDPTHGRTITTPADKAAAIFSALIAFFHPVSLGLTRGQTPKPANAGHLPPLPEAA